MKFEILRKLIKLRKFVRIIEIRKVKETFNYNSNLKIH